MELDSLLEVHDRNWRRAEGKRKEKYTYACQNLNKTMIPPKENEETDQTD